MAAFSHNQEQHSHDSVFLPNMSFNHKISVASDQNAFFLSFHHQGSIPAPVADDPLITILNYETSEQTMNKHCTESLSSVVAESATATVGDQFAQNSIASATSMANKRKISDGSSSSLTSAHSKAVSESVKGKKQKKGSNGEERAKKVHMGEKKKEEGYIHVRARRGQATDSHSLAERIRREKISEKMKQLQALVPGCDKVTGKALMLDEIINYLQSLQHQVEFLSMKLSSFNPMFYDFGTDLDAFMLVPNEGISNFMPNVQHCKSPNFNDSTSTSTLATPNNNFPILDPSSRLFQDNGQLLWPDIDEQRQRLIGLSGFMANNNLGSFH